MMWAVATKCQRRLRRTATAATPLPMNWTFVGTAPALEVEDAAAELEDTTVAVPLAAVEELLVVLPLED